MVNPNADEARKHALSKIAPGRWWTLSNDRRTLWLIAREWVDYVENLPTGHYWYAAKLIKDNPEGYPRVELVQRDDDGRIVLVRPFDDEAWNYAQWDHWSTTHRTRREALDSIPWDDTNATSPAEAGDGQSHEGITPR